MAVNERFHFGESTIARYLRRMTDKNPIINDEETKSILADMKADGIEAVGQEPTKEPTKEPEPVPEAKDEPKSEVVDPQTKEPQEEPKDAETTTKTDDEGRKVQFLPIGQVKAEKKALEKRLRGEFDSERGTLQSTIDTLTSQLQGKTTGERREIKAEITDEVKKVAEKWSVEPEMVLDILALTPTPEPQPALSEEDREVLAHARERAEADHQISQFNEHFEKEVAASDELRKAIEDRGYSLSEVKSKLQTFALGTEGEPYAKVPLDEILTLKLAHLLPQKKKTAEPGRGGTASGTQKGYSKDSMPTPEEIAAMTPEEFDKFSDDLGKGSMNVIRRL